MKKLTFALFVAFGATLFVSCGPKIDTPENLGKSLIEALSSQDQEDYAELFITKEEMLSLIDEAGKTQTDEANKNGLEEEKKNVQEKFDERVTKSIKTSYDGINEDATEEKINWEKVEFVSVESKEETNQFKVKILNARVYFKTENALNFYLDYTALQVDGDWKIVDVDGIRVKK